MTTHPEQYRLDEHLKASPLAYRIQCRKQACCTRPGISSEFDVWRNSLTQKVVLQTHCCGATLTDRWLKETWAIRVIDNLTFDAFFPSFSKRPLEFQGHNT